VHNIFTLLFILRSIWLRIIALVHIKLTTLFKREDKQSNTSTYLGFIVHRKMAHYMQLRYTWKTLKVSSNNLEGKNKYMKEFSTKAS